jgi:DNA-binding NarL/FixJ family response regulator
VTTRPDPHSPVAVVFDRYRLFLDAVESTLQGPGVTIAGKATRPDDTLELIEKHDPDLLIVGLADASDVAIATQLVREAVQRRPELKVIVLATGADIDVAGEIFEAGAAAFVSRNGSNDDVGFAIRQTYEPSIHFAPLRKAAAKRGASPAPKTTLTRRELEILQLVAQGQSNAEVAAALWVTEQTVKFHLSNVFRKLGVSNRTHATRKAHQLGLVSDEESDVEASAMA